MSRRESNTPPIDFSKEFERKLLDSYFLFRDCLPREGYIQENKTTVRIQDELLPMCRISQDSIVSYMLEHDYSTATEPDGTVTWAVWRKA